MLWGRDVCLRDRVDQSKMEGIVRQSGPDGEAQEWTLFAVAFEGLVRQFFEIDPDWDQDQPDDPRPATPSEMTALIGDTGGRSTRPVRGHRLTG